MTSKRTKPSELPALGLVKSTEAGEILEAPEELTPSEVKAELWKGRTYSGSEILEKLQPREWIIPGWLPRDGVAAIYAPSGRGKSFYALSMALELARGGSFAGVPLEASSVLYVAAERPTDQRDRFEAWSLRHGEKELSGFALMAAAPQLGTFSDVEALCSLIRERSAKIVVLDTFARMTLGLEENSSKEIGPVMESLDRIREATAGGAVLVVHHTGKDSTRGARGSSAFLAALDVGITLDGDSQALRARVEKSNAGPEPLPEWYKLEPVALPSEPGGPVRSSAVLVPTHAREAGTHLDAALLELLRSHGPMSRTQLLEILEETEGAKPSRSTVWRAAKRLEESGLVTSSGGQRAVFTAKPTE
jgi:DNA-binding PadR family transcriptional regulator